MRRREMGGIIDLEEDTSLVGIVPFPVFRRLNDSSNSVEHEQSVDLKKSISEIFSSVKDDFDTEKCTDTTSSVEKLTAFGGE